MSTDIKRMENLIEELNSATKAYDEGKPYMSDHEWDDLYFELLNLEKITGFTYSDSPTQRIKFSVVSALNKIEHNHPMLSLEKTKSIDELKSFLGNKAYIAMCKMDGLTCSLRYYNGKLVSAETRGDGKVGEDILHNALVIPSIPKYISYKDELVVDGEIICCLDTFNEYFASEYKNSRNFAAGSIRLLDSKECHSRHLTFVAWDVIEGFAETNELSFKLEILNHLGFITTPTLTIGANVDVDLEYVIKYIQDKAQLMAYPIDGVVFKFNDIMYGKSLGATGHHFKNAMAYKFYDETYETKLIDIEWTMGRTGILTPVAIFEPIDIEGSTVERASLHNVDILWETLHCWGWPGQKVEVFKANMIIPQIASAEPNDDIPQYDRPYFQYPKICPICGEPTEIRKDVSTRNLCCTNSSCEGKLINRLDHFCGKKGLDIKGLSKATLEKLIGWNWVNEFTDIFELKIHRPEWITKPGFGAKSVDKILSAIDASSNCELHQFIAALGIPLIGSTASKELAKYFKTWGEFVNAAENDFAFYTLPNFGSEMHSSIVKFNYTEAKLLAEHYINFIIPEETPILSGEDLTGKTFVITGKLAQFKNRDEIKTKIESMGGKVTGSVTKNTDFLINNDNKSTSAKNLSAQKLGIPIITEDDFINRFL